MPKLVEKNEVVVATAAVECPKYDTFLRARVSIKSFV